MDGVTILQTIEVAQYGFGWTWIAIFPLIITIGAIALGIFGILCNDGPVAGFAMTITVLGLVGLFAICEEGKELPPTYQYQVLVEDNVNMNDFLEKYTVVEQQGITYIVEEKNE